MYMALFKFTSVVQILDHVDKNHMNTHYFRCSLLNKLIIITMIINNSNNNNEKVKHYTSFSVGSVNK